MVMKTIAAAKFKAQCLTLMEGVRKTRQPLVITKRGKPIAKLAPLDDMKDDFFDRLKGQFQVVGDIVSPLVPLEDWDALK
jgi:prevent-host-death family protein